MASSSSTLVRVDIVSDVVCPWCYVGYRRFLRGWDKLQTEWQSQSQEARIHMQLRWRPFQLDPTLPKEGMKTREALRKKFGSDRMQALQHHLEQAGKEEGIAFKWENTVANTMDAHRLVEWVAQKDEKKHNDFMQVLFRCYFEEDGHIGDHKMLLDAVEEVGLDRAEADQYLQSNQGAEQVEKDILYYRQKYRIAGVPYFIVHATDGSKTSNEVTASGAQESGYFIALIEQVLEGLQ